MNFFLHESVGTPVAFTLRLQSAKPNAKLTWYLDFVTLNSDSVTVKFPCYQWLTEKKSKTICVPYGYLPDKIGNLSISKNLLQERFNEIEVQKSKYQWTKVAGIPSFLRGTEYGAYELVPLDEKFGDFKNKDFSYLVRNNLFLRLLNFIFFIILKVAKGTQNTIANLIKSKLHIFQTLDDYKKLYSLHITEAVHEPEVTKNWLNDDIFG
jgi:hypothetical protein